MLNPVSCGVDGLLGDAHDAADVTIFLTRLIEDEEEGVVGVLAAIKTNIVYSILTCHIYTPIFSLGESVVYFNVMFI